MALVLILQLCFYFVRTCEGGIHSTPNKWNHGGQCWTIPKLFCNVNLFVNYWFFLSFKGHRFQRWPSSWITFPSTRLSKLYKSKKSIWLWSLIGTRCCQRGKHKWISPLSNDFHAYRASYFKDWCLEDGRHFRLDTTRERRYFMCLPWWQTQVPW